MNWLASATTLPAVLLLLPVPASSDDAGPLVLRSHQGTYSCSHLVTGRRCGDDHWTMTVLSDGSRLLGSTSRRPEGGGSLLVMTLHVDAGFRPVDAYENVYSAGRWLGAGHFLVDGAVLRMSINGPDGHFILSADAPGQFSLLLHPPAADGWHFAFYDHVEGGVQRHPVCTVGRARRGVACEFNEVDLSFVGRERITVPAGSFDTQRYRFGETTEIWTTGPDRIVVRHVFGAAQSSTELTSWIIDEGD
jgi:hypothetical protein